MTQPLSQSDSHNIAAIGDELVPSALGKFSYFNPFSLRNRLLLTIVPTVLVSLAIASLVGYKIIYQKTEEETKLQLQNKAILAGKTIDELLQQASQIPETTAESPQIINSILQSRKQVQNSNFAQLSIDDLEAKFNSTKLLAPNQELNNYLQRIVKVTGLGEIFYTESHGFNIAYSNPTSDFVQKGEDWWEKGKAQTQWTSPPELDESSNTFGFSLVQAIKEPKSGEFLGVIKAVLPDSYLNPVAEKLAQAGLKNSQTIQIITPGSDILIQTITAQGLSNDKEIMGGKNIIQVAQLLLKQGENKEQLEQKLKQEYSFRQVTFNQEKQIISFAYQNKYYTLFIVPGRDWLAVASINYQELGAVGNELAPILLINGLIVAAVATLIISLVANQISRPIDNLVETAEEAASGNLNVTANPIGAIEVKILAQSFNNLIFQVKNLLEQQKNKAEQAKNLQEITLTINKLSEEKTILSTAIQEVRQLLKTERVIYYRFDESWQGNVIAESVEPGYLSILDKQIYDPCFADQYADKYQQGRILATNNILESNLIECYLQQLKSFQVKANLIVPVLLQGKLDGLLIAHQCSSSKNWQPTEIDLFNQIANQIGFAIDRVNFYKQLQAAEAQEKLAKEKMQTRALELLMQVYPLNQGDLTIRAQVTEDEIGTIADSYNSTIASLHKIVTQVKTAAEEVAATTQSNEESINELAEKTNAQAEAIGKTVEIVQAMNESILAVADNARQAEKIVQEANETISTGDLAMNQAVAEISSIQATVTETTNKMKKLGESSQTISQVVNLISRFAAQTHLLALKASIEAARAGEQGKGFAVIADEVRSLATQSAEATREIENLVARIQLETNEVVAAMEVGTEQVTIGAKLVYQTRQSLNQVTVAAAEIDQLINAIAFASIEQSQTSEVVTETITDVATIAEDNSRSANHMLLSLQQLSTVADKLQTSIDKFKI